MKFKKQKRFILLKVIGKLVFAILILSACGEDKAIRNNQVNSEISRLGDKLKQLQEAVGKTEQTQSEVSRPLSKIYEESEEEMKAIIEKTKLLYINLEKTKNNTECEKILTQIIKLENLWYDFYMLYQRTPPFTQITVIKEGDSCNKNGYVNNKIEVK
ncbi:MAG: hypothetical protein OXN83_04140 [Oligoflexia bacterium]|nr:hypothetical protein [Oligoflexia bacterium]